MGPPKLGADDRGDTHEPPESAIVLRVCALLAERFDICLDKVRPEYQLVRDLNLDPFDVADLPLALEEAFEINISNADADQIVTVEDAARCVASSRGM